MAEQGRARRRWPWLLAGIVLLLPALLGVPALLYRPPATGAPAADGLTRVRLGIHVHTDAAGGAGSIDDIVRAAARAGLDALWLTDHDGYPGAPAQGWHGAVLVLVGCERDTSAGHLLALGTRVPPFPLAEDALDAIADSHELGAVALAAHPFRRGPDRLRWRDRGGGERPQEQLDGVEIVNLDAAVREQPWRWPSGLLGSLLGRPAAIARLAAPETRALALWDRMLEERPALALAGSDAHGLFPGYAPVLATVANVVLLERPLRGAGAGRDGDGEDVAAVAAAVARGRVLIAWTAVADPGAASFLAQRGEERFLPGDVASEGAPLTLELRSGLAVAATLRIVHRGRTVASAQGAELRFEASEPGAYRGEIDVPGAPHSPWLLSNAIALAGPGWPVPPPVPVPSALPPSSAAAAGPGVDLLARVQPEHDPRSWLEVERAPEALSLRWQLGAPDREQKDVWVALVDRTPRDLAAFRALAIDADAVAPVRFDLGFTSADGVRTVRSVRLDATRRRIRLPLASFGRGAPPRRSDHLLLTLDQDNAWPGSQGAARIYELRLE